MRVLPIPESIGGGLDQAGLAMIRSEGSTQEVVDGGRIERPDLAGERRPSLSSRHTLRCLDDQGGGVGAVLDEAE